MPFTIGTKVIALVDVVDEDRTIARPGESGVVVDVSGPFPTVRFDRTGAASMVDPDVEVVHARAKYGRC